MAKSKKKTKPVKNKRVKRKAPARKQIKRIKRKPARKFAARKSSFKKTAAKKKSAPKKPVPKAKQAPPVGGFPAELHAAAMKILKERQAEDIVSINLAGRSAMADYLIIATGRASRQIVAIADYLRRTFDDLGAQKIRVEGLPQGNWVLVDCGDVIVHLFRPEVRRYYGLDKIWDK
jgi:ribosome-associated protein